MKYLFIGGPADGKRIEIEGEPSGYVFVQLTKPSPVMEDPRITPADQIQTLYHRKVLRELSGERFVIYSATEDIIGKLVKGYAEPEDPGQITVPFQALESVVHTARSPDLKSLRTLYELLERHLIKHG